VAGGGDVEDGEVERVLREVEDGAGEDAGVEGDGFAGLEVDVEVVFGAEGLDNADEAVDVVARAGDVMAATKVDPFEAGEEFGEFLLEGGDGVLEGVAVLLAERVEMQAVEAIEIGGGEFGADGAEAGAGSAGIVEVGSHFRILGIDAEAGVDGAAGGANGFAEAAPLRGGIEDEGVGETREVRELGVLVGDAVDVDLAREEFVREQSFVQAAGSGARKVFGDERVSGRAGEALLGEEDFATGALGDIGKQAAVLLEQAQVDDKARGRQAGDVERGEGGEAFGRERRRGVLGHSYLFQINDAT